MSSSERLNEPEKQLAGVLAEVDQLQLWTVGKVRPPQLVDGGRLVLELAGGLHDDEGRVGDQVMRPEQTVNAGFRYEVALFIGKRHFQFAWA